MTSVTPFVLILGGGASAFYGADGLIKAGFHVAMINQDIPIGGGTRSFIRYDKVWDTDAQKPKMKMQLLKNFFAIFKQPQFVGYYGGVRVGQKEPFSLRDLAELNPDAWVLANGSRGKKGLRLPGIELTGVYDAYDLAQHYNQMPGYENMAPRIGKNVAILGVGNVTADMIFWLADQKKPVETITVFARRGPFEFKMRRPEVKEILPHMDFADLLREVERVLKLFYADRSLPYFESTVYDEETGQPRANETPLMGNLSQDIEAVLKGLLFTSEEIQKITAGSLPQGGGPRVRFRFLTQPERMEGSARELSKIVFSKNILAWDVQKKQVQAQKIQSLDSLETIQADTFIFSIGSSVDPTLGMPSCDGRWEVDPAHPYRLKGQQRAWAFGWARRPSHGLVGEAKQDAAKGLLDLVSFLKENGAQGNPSFQAQLENRLRSRGQRWVTKEETVVLHEAEVAQHCFFTPSQITAFLKNPA